MGHWLAGDFDVILAPARGSRYEVEVVQEHIVQAVELLARVIVGATSVLIFDAPPETIVAVPTIYTPSILALAHSRVVRAIRCIAGAERDIRRSRIKDSILLENMIRDICR